MRRRYIDWARALAILLMVEAHTIDAWTRAADRHTPAFRNLTVLGGFAAPLFLWLAGVALVLSAERTRERTGSTRAAVTAIVRRGLEIFILAFLFRIQAFIVSPGSYLVMVFGVDILNVMGPAIVIAALVWGMARRPAARAAVFGAIATAIAMLTPLVRTAAWVQDVPLWLRWYFRPDADYTTFTLFPWAGFVFAGAAAGAVLAAASGSAVEKRAQVALGAAGAALLAVGFLAAGRPTIYAQSSFWTSSPTFFAIRVGALMLASSGLYAADRFVRRAWAPSVWLEWFGRSSLFVYWIHVELVYGYATWPLRRHLHLWQLGVAYVLFVTLLHALVVLRDRVVTGWKTARSAPDPATSIAV